MNHGSVTRSQFRRVLSLLSLDILTEDEYQAIYRVYGKVEGDETTVDYMHFCRRLRSMVWRARHLPKPTEPNQSGQSIRPQDYEREYRQFLSTGGEDVVFDEDRTPKRKPRPNIVFRTAD